MRDLKLHHVYHSLCVGICIGGGRGGFGDVGGRGGGDCESCYGSKYCCCGW